MKEGRTEILHLQIKREYLEQILFGDKTEETREIRPNNLAKYFQTKGGELIEPLKLKQFKALVLYNGYQPNRPEVHIEITGELLEFQTDEKNEYLTYKLNGEEYVYCNVVYNLGKVLKKVGI